MTDYITPTITTTTTNVDIFGDNYATQRESLVAEYGDFEISSGSLYLNDSTRGSLYVAGENSFVCNTFSIFDSYANKQEGTANNISIGYISGVPTIKLSNTQSSLHISSLNVSGIKRLTFDYDTTDKKGIQGTTTTTSTAVLGITAGLLDNLSSGSSIFMYGNQTTSKPNSMDIWGTNTSTSVLSINYFKGGVGINTATPTSGYALDVNGSLKVSGSSTFNNTATFTTANTTTLNVSGTINAEKYTISGQSGFLKADGTVDSSTYLTSIGDITTLNVTESSTFNGDLIFNATSATKQEKVLRMSANTGYITLRGGTGWTSTGAVLQLFGKDNNNGNAKLLSGVANSTLELTFKGGVGINTANPISGYALDVNGSLNVSGTINAEKYTVSGQSGFLKADGTVDSSTYLTSIDGSGIKRLTFDYDTTDKKGIQGTTTTTSTAVLGITAGLLDNLSSGSSIFMYGNQTTSKPNSMDIWGTNTSTSVLSINYFKGGVGINTATPTSGYALDVNGGLVVSGTIWSKSALYAYNYLYIPTWDNFNQVWDSNLSMFYYDKTYNKLCIMYANNVHSVQLV